MAAAAATPKPIQQPVSLSSVTGAVTTPVVRRGFFVSNPPVVVPAASTTQGIHAAAENDNVVVSNTVNVIPNAAFIVQTQEEFDAGAAVTTPYVQAFPFKEVIVVQFPEGPRKQLEIIRTISTHNKPKLFIGGYCYRRERHGPPVTSWTCAKLGCWARISERNGELQMKAGSFGHTHGADMIDIELQLVLINQKHLALTTTESAREIVSRTTQNLLEATAALMPSEQAQKQRVYDFRHAERERLALVASGVVSPTAAAAAAPAASSSTAGGSDNVTNVLHRDGRLVLSSAAAASQQEEFASTSEAAASERQQPIQSVVLMNADDDVAAVTGVGGENDATTLTLELDDDDVVNVVVGEEGGLLSEVDEVLLSHHQD